MRRRNENVVHRFVSSSLFPRLFQQIFLRSSCLEVLSLTVPFLELPRISGAESKRDITSEMKNEGKKEREELEGWESERGRKMEKGEMDPEN